MAASRSEVLFIGGRSGVGKSSVGNEVHVQLSALDLRHCFIEGDNLDMAHPPTWEFGLAEQNLSAMWRNYRKLGYRRMVYTNTISVLVTGELTAAMGDDPEVIAVLLTSSDSTVRQRLGRREIGTALEWHVERSALMARELDELAPEWVHRLNTDGREVSEIASLVIGLSGWNAPS